MIRISELDTFTFSTQSTSELASVSAPSVDIDCALTAPHVKLKSPHADIYANAKPSVV